MVRHFKTLDAMRGVAALAVLALHVCRLFDFPLQPQGAHLAVDFFFMLSGFVIAQAYEARLMAGWSALAFLRKRLIRFYPMILVGAAGGLVVLAARQVMFHDISWPDIALAAAPNLLLIPSPALQGFRAFSFPLNSPFWSLSCEMAANVVYALIAVRLTTPRLAVLVGLSAAALAVMSLQNHGVDNGYYWRDYGLGLVRAAFPFLAGVMIHRIALPKVASTALNLPIVVLLGALLLSPIAVTGPYEFLVVMLAFPAMLVAGAAAVPSRRLEPLWQGLGELSYPLYAVHYPIVAAMAQVSKSAHLGGAARAGLAVACGALALAIAYGALVLFDRPVRAWLERAAPRAPGDRPGAGRPAPAGLAN